jgi:hypothetical protein
MKHVHAPRDVTRSGLARAPTEKSSFDLLQEGEGLALTAREERMEEWEPLKGQRDRQQRPREQVLPPARWSMCERPLQDESAERRWGARSCCKYDRAAK